jgi:hypothetical protein
MSASTVVPNDMREKNSTTHLRFGSVGEKTNS